MKFFAAAILAFGASAIRLAEEEKKEEHEHELPHEPPTCPEFDLAFVTEALSSAEAFVASINTNGDEFVNTQEVFNALWCMHEWELISECDGIKAYEEFQEHAGEEAKVPVADAVAAVQKEFDDGHMPQPPAEAPADPPADAPTEALTVDPIENTTEA